MEENTYNNATYLLRKVLTRTVTQTTFFSRDLERRRMKNTDIQHEGKFTSTIFGKKFTIRCIFFLYNEHLEMKIKKFNRIGSCFKICQRKSRNPPTQQTRAVIPKVCSADHQWSARLAEVVCQSLYKSISYSSRTTEFF